MDIEKLKGAWKKYTSELKKREAKGTEELRGILKQKSQHALIRLRKNFLIEAGLNIAAIPVLFIIVMNGFEVGVPLKYFIGFFLIVLLVMFLVFLYRSYMRIYRYEHYRLTLEKKLEEQIHALKKFRNRYEQITYIMYFVALVSGLLLIMPFNPAVLTSEFAFATGAGVLIFFVLIKPLTKYYLKRLYGKHLHALQMYLDELSDVSSEKNEPDD
ncbi:MAG: hypothetical protein ACLFM7_08990 [Bacteroidales bacterium]